LIVIIYGVNKLVDVRRFCPALQGLPDDEIENLVPIVSRELYEEDKVGKVRCKVPNEQMINAGLFDGCRSVTQINSTGCILRNAEAVKLDITGCR